MRISVTQEDIDTGSHSGMRCPVFRAIKRAGVNVTYAGTMGCNYNGGKNYRNWPTQVSDWIHNYDATETAEPFEFEMDFEEGK